MSRLQNDDPFPDVTGSTLEHGELTVPSDLTRAWTALLYYRGEW